MKQIILSCLLGAFLFSACSRNTVGCRDPLALNYRADADTDGPCSFTTAIFYNASNMLGGIGVPLDSVRIVDFDFGGTREETVLSTLTTFNHAEPFECQADPESFVWELSEGRKYYVAYYYFQDGEIIRELGDWLEVSSTTECLEIKLTL